MGCGLLIIQYLELGSSSEAESDDQESDDDDDESSDDGAEDDEATLLTPAVDSQILKTIAAIRTKDARVYDSDQKFFTDDQFEEAQKKLQQKEREAQRKKYTLRDYEDEVNVEYGGVIPEDNDESAESSTKIKTHQEEQDELKNAFKMAAGIAEDDDNEDGFLQKREKTEDEIKAEEEEYRNFLLANISVSKNDKMNDVWNGWSNGMIEW